MSAPPAGQTPLTPGTVAILTLPPLAWAANAVIGRMAVGQIPPVLLNGLRWVVVLVLLLPLGWRVFARPGLLRRHAGYLALLGLLGMGCYNALQYMALHTSTALNTTLIGASSPLWMLLTGLLLFQVRPRRRQLVGALLSLLGVALVISRGSWHNLVRVSFVPGDLLMLLAVAAWSVYSWLLVRPPASIRQDRQAPWPWPWAQFLLAQTVFGLAWSAAFSGVEHAVAPAAWHWTPTLALIVFFVGAIPGLAAYRAWGVGVQRVGPAVAGFFANLTPVFAAIMGAALLGEAPRLYHAGAFALIVAGIVVSSRK